MFENLIADLRASQEDRVLEKGMGLWRVFFRMETPAIISYRFGNWVAKLKTPVISQILGIVAGIVQRLVQILIGIYISPDAEIGPGLVIHTPFGIIVGPNKIGSHLTIQSGVVIAAGTRRSCGHVHLRPRPEGIGGAEDGKKLLGAAHHPGPSAVAH